MVSAVVFILVTMSLLLFVCFGVGLAFSRPLHLFQQGTKAQLINCNAIGLGLILLILQFVHFVLPITSNLILWFMAIAIVSIVAASLSGSLRITHMSWRMVVASVLFVSLLAIVACHSLGFFQVSDGIAYHWNLVKWTNQYPIIPGLANVYERLGSNNSIHLFAAMLNTGLLSDHANLVNCFMISLMLVHVAAGFVGMSQRRGSQWGNIMGVACLLPIFYHIFANPAGTADIGYVSSDEPMSWMVFLGLMSVVHFMFGAEKSDKPSHLATAVICFATAATIKLSGIFVFAVAAMLLIILLVKSREYRTWRYATLYGVATLMIVCSAVRGVIISGLPWFPIDKGFDVPWRLPSKEVAAGRFLIDVHARFNGNMNHTQTESYLFHPDFLGQFTWSNSGWGILIATFSLLMAIVVMYKYQRRQMMGSFKKVCCVYTLIIGPLLFWIVTAPAMRFAWHFFWLIPIVALVYLFYVTEGLNLSNFKERWLVRLMAPAMVCLWALFYVGSPVMNLTGTAFYSGPSVAGHEFWNLVTAKRSSEQERQAQFGFYYPRALVGGKLIRVQASSGLIFVLPDAPQSATLELLIGDLPITPHAIPTSSLIGDVGLLNPTKGVAGGFYRISSEKGGILTRLPTVVKQVASR